MRLCYLAIFLQVSVNNTRILKITLCSRLPVRVLFPPSHLKAPAYIGACQILTMLPKQNTFFHIPKHTNKMYTQEGELLPDKRCNAKALKGPHMRVRFPPWSTPLTWCSSHYEWWITCAPASQQLDAFLLITCTQRGSYRHAITTNTGSTINEQL